MLKGLFGAQSIAPQLRAGLDDATATHRAIAARVAGALDASANVDFSQELQASVNGQKFATDLARDMSELADVQLRFEADAKLLQEAYGRLRTAMRNHG
jgi:flagellar basal body rod protein FlgB